MERIKVVLAIGLLILLPARGLVASSLQLFSVEAEAQMHCPADTVVWLNTPTGIYHFKGMRWYANTIRGAYICQKEGDQAGYRATRNGQ